MSQDFVRKIRNLIGAKLPIIRPSIQKIIEPEQLEESVLAAVIKHFNLKDIVNNISSHEKDMSAEYFSLLDILTEVYHRFNGMLRILQQIGELENLWQSELKDFDEKKTSPNETFFDNFCHDESKMRNLALLSFIQNIDFDPQMPEKSVDDLKNKMELDSLQDHDFPNLIKTRGIVEAIMQRIDLLLKVSIPNTFEINQSEGMSRSLQSWPSSGQRTWKSQMSGNQVYDDSILQIPKLQRIRKIRKNNSLNYEPIISSKESGSQYSHQLDQLFEFIGSHPEKAILSNEFIEASRTRKIRGICRKQALNIMKTMLQSSDTVGSGTYMINTISFLLQDGPKLDDLTCGGMKNEVLELFSQVLTHIVAKSSQNMLHCKTSICILCIIPYSRVEEVSLLKCGLVNLLDKLCGLNPDSNCSDFKAETISSQKELSMLAWAGFKVLANRCMKWQENFDEDDAADIMEGEFHTLRLPQQVSILLTNNLIRAKNVSNETSNYESLQEILTLLNTLSESTMGKDILSQPTCISKLLSLLLEPKLSPRMIQTIVQLCHCALPLLCQESFSQVEVPSWTLGDEEITYSDIDPCKNMIRLLLAKISDYLVPGYQISAKVQNNPTAPAVNVSVDIIEDDIEESTIIPNDIPDMDRTMSLYLYKREDEATHDVIQHLLNVSAELRLFRMTESQNMEKIVKMDKELNKVNKTEVTTDDATVILRRAIKLAQQGFIVSVGPPQRSEEFSDEKKDAVELIARERNVSLSKHDPFRPFISSSVSNNLASDLIALIHRLFTSKTADVWIGAIHEIVTVTIKKLRKIAESQELLTKDNNSEIFSLYKDARDILSILATLGGYTESLKPGLEVSIIGSGIEGCIGEIISISESTGQATVKLSFPEDVSHFPRPSNILQVPLERIRVCKKLNPVSLFMPIAKQLVDALQSVLLPDPSGTDPLSVPLPSIGDGRSLKLSTARLIAEIRSKATQVLALYLKDAEFSCRFLQSSCQAVDMLKCFSKDCLPSDRVSQVSSATEKLRNLYRDCVKPPAPPSRKLTSKHKMMVWDPSKTFPPLKSVLFSHNMHGITYYDDPGNNAGQPRGILAYASQMIPSTVNNFYWELDILSLGDAPDDTGSPIISVGFAPVAEKKDGAWSNPVGTMFFHNNGRVVHYNGQSLLQWRSLRFDIQLNPGDTIGIGWEKLFEASNAAPSSGRVYFTINGNKLDQALEYVNGNMYPVVHIQKKNVRVKANFGNHKFLYAEGRLLQSKNLESSSDGKERKDEGLSSMPFQGSNDSSGSSSPESFDVGAGHRRYSSHSFRTATCPKGLKEYSPSNNEDFRSEPSHEPGAHTGSHIQPITLLDEDSDSEEESDDENVHPHDDINSLLVKSWETKVFPIIRRRFRNETERRDGLDQIKGALSLGMADIARQTVEFLYEENGGIPKDLHLPTVEDIKEDLNKFSIDRIKRGQPVFISNNSDMDLTSLPKYCVPIMLKTFGLSGEVLEVDSQNELVQVETYLRLEGILVRFWYPLNILEKPQDCSKKTAVTGAQVVNINNYLVHRELLSWEFAYTRLNCREAYTTLLMQAKNEDLSTYVCVDECSSEATMIKSSIMLFQDVDIENLQYISNTLLATPDNGNMMEKNLNITTATNVLKLLNGRVSDLFYHDASLLKQEIIDYIKKAGNKGEDFLIELSNQVCEVVQHAPEMFTTEEIVINDISTLKSCICFPKAAFVTASVKIKREIQELNDLKDLTIQIQTIDGITVRQNGQISSRDIVQYPIEVSGLKDPLQSAFQPVIMATNTVKISHSGGEDMGFKLFLHSIPQEFPLAIMFIEEVVKNSQNNPHSSCSVTTAVAQNFIGMIGRFLIHMDISQIIKERVLLLFAELIRINGNLENKTLSHSIFNKLNEEMKMVYSFETSRKHFVRFSTYFLSLFEVSAAITESTESSSSFFKSRSPTPMIDKESSPGFCPTFFKRRLRLKSSRRSISPNSETMDKIHSPNNESSIFSKAIGCSKFLKYLVKRGSKEFEESVNQIKQIYLNQPGPNDHTRLLIIKGLPRHFTEEQLKTEIQKALNNFGGLFKEEVYIIPVTEIETVKPSVEVEDQIVVENIEFDSDQELPDIDLEDNYQRQRTESYVEPVTPTNSGMAVLQVRTSCNLSKCKEELESNSKLNIRGEYDSDGSLLTTSGVLPTLHSDDPFMDKILESYLFFKAFSDKYETLHQDCYNALEDIFLSCYIANQKDTMTENMDSEDVIALQFSHILKQVEENMMYTFLYGIKQSRGGLLEGVREILHQYGKQCRTPAEFVPDTPPRKNKTLDSNKLPADTSEDRQVLGK